MPELCSPTLHTLLPDILSILCVDFDNVECEMEACPDLTKKPFNLSTKFLGQLLYIVPASVPTEEASLLMIDGKIIATTNNFHVLSDNKPSFILRISLELQGHGDERQTWRKSLFTCFERLLGDNWEMLCISVDEFDSIQIDLLRNGYLHETAERPTTNGVVYSQRKSKITLWLTLISRRIVAGTRKSVNNKLSEEEAEKPKKKKTVKKVLRDLFSPNSAFPSNVFDENLNESLDGLNTESTLIIDTSQSVQLSQASPMQSSLSPSVPLKTLVSATTVRCANGTKKIQKKIVDKSSPKETSPIPDDDSSLKTQNGNSLLNGVNANASILLNGTALPSTSESGREPAKKTANGFASANPSTNSLFLQKVNGDAKKSASASSSNGSLVGKIAAMFNGTPADGSTPNKSTTKQRVSETAASRIPTSKSPKNNEESRLLNGKLESNLNLKCEESNLTSLDALEKTLEASKKSPESLPTNSTTLNSEQSELHNSNSSSRKAPRTTLYESSEKTRELSPLLQTKFTDSSLEEDKSLSHQKCSPDNDNKQLTTTSNRSNILLQTSTRQTLGTPSSRQLVSTTIRQQLNPMSSSSYSSRALSPISSAGTRSDTALTDDENDETLFNDDLLILNSQMTTVTGNGDEEEEEDLGIEELSFREDLSTCNSEAFVAALADFQRLPSMADVAAGKASSTKTSSVTQRRNSNGVLCPAVPPRPLLLGTAAKKTNNSTEFPAIVLQLVLSRLSYKEMSIFRRVHPHWDEICGQLLNSGYYSLIHAADRLLTDCQRKVHNEKRLAKPIVILTNLQVHVLNPVDVLRAAMDEGVLCFPYGLILDKAFELLENIQMVVASGEELITNLNWEELAELARRAQVHYRRFVEPEAEKRMSEVYKLSAAQRLQRLDSFMVEASVNKLEKVAEKAKDDLRWEIEQLKTQNQQLKKDNRELKNTCLKLDSRVEVLERKFKTMARLLQ